MVYAYAASAVHPALVGAQWRTAAGAGLLSGTVVCLLYPQVAKYLAGGCVEHHVAGNSPSSCVLAAVTATLEDFKLAALTDEFPDSMLLDRHERALLNASMGAGLEQSTRQSPYFSMSESMRRAGMFHVSPRTNRTKTQLLRCIGRVSSGDKDFRPRPQQQSCGSNQLRVEPVQDDSTHQVASLLLAIADDEQEEDLHGELRPLVLLKFMQLWKYFFENYATTHESFRKALLEPLVAALGADDGRLKLRRKNESSMISSSAAEAGPPATSCKWPLYRAVGR